MIVRNLDAIYFNDNSTQSLIRIYLTLSLAKTQGSLSSANTQLKALYTPVLINESYWTNLFYIQVKLNWPYWPVRDNMKYDKIDKRI